jgi:hypothetical protein
VLPAGFEPTIPASERLQTHALDRADWERAPIRNMMGNVAHTATLETQICPIQHWTCKNILCNPEIFLVAVTSVRVLTRLQTDLERGEQTIQ